MYREKHQYGQDPQHIICSAHDTFNAPIKRDRRGQFKWPSGSKVFVCSWSDFFHPAADQWRPLAYNVMRQRPDLIYQIVTKRPEMIADRLPSDWGDGWPNTWLITSIESNKYSHRWDTLKQIPARIRGISYEPALEWLNFYALLIPSTASIQSIQSITAECTCEPFHMLCGSCQALIEAARESGLHWLIAGTESGPYARPYDLSWFRNIRDICNRARIPFFMKQLTKDGRKIAYDKWPRDLQIRQFPATSKTTPAPSPNTTATSPTSTIPSKRPVRSSIRSSTNQHRPR